GIGGGPGWILLSPEATNCVFLERGASRPSLSLKFHFILPNRRHHVTPPNLLPPAHCPFTRNDATADRGPKRGEGAPNQPLRGVDGVWQASLRHLCLQYFPACRCPDQLERPRFRDHRHGALPLRSQPFGALPRGHD